MSRHFSHEDMIAFGRLLDLIDEPQKYGLVIDTGDPETYPERAGGIVEEARARLESLRRRRPED